MKRGIILSGHTKPNLNKIPNFYYITGTDGTGKSTQAELLSKHLELHGIRCRRLWLRFPFFFSIPLLAYARLKRYSWHEVNSQVDHGYWDFTRSWAMRNIFPWVLFLDAALAALGKIYVPLLFGETIICERFVVDMLVDVSIATKNPFYIDHLPGRLFPSLLPKNIKIVILDLDQVTICRRRANLVFDHALSSRLHAYHVLADRLKIRIVDNHPSIPVVHQEILSIMGLS